MWRCTTPPKSSWWQSSMTGSSSVWWTVTSTRSSYFWNPLDCQGNHSFALPRQRGRGCQAVWDGKSGICLFVCFSMAFWYYSGIYSSLFMHSSFIKLMRFLMACDLDQLFLLPFYHGASALCLCLRKLPPWGTILRSVGCAVFSVLSTCLFASR